jgi:hypothetical protein
VKARSKRKQLVARPSGEKGDMTFKLDSATVRKGRLPPAQNLGMVSHGGQDDDGHGGKRPPAGGCTTPKPAASKKTTNSVIALALSIA